MTGIFIVVVVLIVVNNNTNKKNMLPLHSRVVNNRVYSCSLAQNNIS